MLTKVKGVVLANSVDTVADLATANKGSAIQVLGFHTKGDGGGGVFFYDDTEDKANHNGGTVIDPAKAGLVADWNNNQEDYFTAGSGVGVWKREYSGAVNVKWFGAVGDGDVDDTDPIQKAVDVSNSVEMHNGTFLLKWRNKSVLNSFNCAVILREGVFLDLKDSIIKTEGGYYSAFMAAGVNGGVQVKDIKITGGIFEGNGKRKVTTTHSTFTNGSSSLSVVDVSWINVGQWLSIIANDGTGYVRKVENISGNILTLNSPISDEISIGNEVRSTNTYGIGIYHSVGVSVSNVTFKNLDIGCAVMFSSNATVSEINVFDFEIGLGCVGVYCLYTDNVSVGGVSGRNVDRLVRLRGEGVVCNNVSGYNTSTDYDSGAGLSFETSNNVVASNVSLSGYGRVLDVY